MNTQLWGASLYTAWRGFLERNNALHYHRYNIPEVMKPKTPVALANGALFGWEAGFPGNDGSSSRESEEPLVSNVTGS